MAVSVHVGGCRWIVIGKQHVDECGDIRDVHLGVAIDVARNLGRNHGEDARRAQIAAVNGRGSDCGGASSECCHTAGLVNAGNGRVAAGPGHTFVSGLLGQHSGP